MFVVNWNNCQQSRVWVYQTKIAKTPLSKDYFSMMLFLCQSSTLLYECHCLLCRSELPWSWSTSRGETRASSCLSTGRSLWTTSPSLSCRARWPAGWPMSCPGSTSSWGTRKAWRTPSSASAYFSRSMSGEPKLCSYSPSYIAIMTFAII